MQRSIKTVQGISVYCLANSHLEIAVVPELGARLISLRTFLTGREWLWHPPGDLNLFRNQPGDDFSLSPLVGIDECLPTIAPCSWQGRSLPDHGEVWSVPWEVNLDAWNSNTLRTAIELKVSPFCFERSIDLNDKAVELTYRLINRSSEAESYLWAIHPLLRFQTGDQLQLPESTRAKLGGAAGCGEFGFEVLEGSCAKRFVTPLTEGWAAIANRLTGERLTFEWDPGQNNTLGLWLTRGGWHGHHHFAIEPTNGQPDALATAARNGSCGWIGPGSSLTWRLGLRLG